MVSGYGVAPCAQQPDARAALVQGIRDFADFAEAHPDVPIDYVLAGSWSLHDRNSSSRARIACDALRPAGFTTTIEGTEVVVRTGFGPVKFETRARAADVCGTPQQRLYVLPAWATPDAADPAS